jgi:hypothetical protein
MFYLIIQALSVIGAIPENIAKLPWDVMPIDMAAEQVAKLCGGEG